MFIPGESAVTAGLRRCLHGLGRRLGSGLRCRLGCRSRLDGCLLLRRGLLNGGSAIGAELGAFLELRSAIRTETHMGTSVLLFLVYVSAAAESPVHAVGDVQFVSVKEDAEGLFIDTLAGKANLSFAV